jgi:hypothetical protein
MTTMSVDAIWQVRFGVGETAPSLGYGVIILQAGKITGGDSSFYYRGEYTLDADTISCRVRVERHTLLLRSVTGFDQATLLLDGRVSDSILELTGYVEEEPSTGFAAILERLADLP